MNIHLGIDDKQAILCHLFLQCKVEEVSSMNVMKQMTYGVYKMYVMGKSENWNRDATLDILKPWISQSLVEVPQSSRYWYLTVHVKILFWYNFC